MESHIQNFTKGLHKDNDKRVQPLNTFRDSSNMRIISNDGNKFAIEMVRGNSEFFNINPNYHPIGWAKLINVKDSNSLTEKVIVFSTNQRSGSIGNGEIGLAYIDPNTNTAQYVPLYNHPDLNFSFDHLIEALGYRENDRIERAYWTDNFNPPRALNLALKSLTQYILNGSLIVGQQYMVVQGSVNHNGNDYGPNVSYPSKSVTTFTAVNANYSDNNIPGFPSLVVLYAPFVKTIDVVPTKNTGTIKIKSVKLYGSVLCGVWQFAYQLQTADGGYTNWSYMTEPTHVAIGAADGGLNWYQNYQGGTSVSPSDKKIDIEVSGIDQNFTRIRIAAVHGTGLNVSSPPIVIKDEVITSDTMTFEYLGNESVEILTIDDLQKTVLSLRRVKTLASVKNRLFYGNIETSLDFDFDPSGAVVDTVAKLFPSDVAGHPFTPNVPYFSGHGSANSSGVGVQKTGGVLIDGVYKVFGSGVGATYNSILYPVGSTFIGIAGFHNWSGPSGIIVKAIIRIERYTGVYDDVVIDSDWYDSKGSEVDTYCRSYWRGETYRLGVLLWDVYGNPIFVRWMKDKVIPRQHETQDPDTLNPIDATLSKVYYQGASVDSGHGDFHESVSLRHIGLKISNLDLGQIVTNLGISNADLPNYISGFSIVRAKRDATIISQGLLYPTVYTSGQPISVVRPMATNKLDTDKNYAAVGRNAFHYSFYSPDMQVRLNGLPNFTDIDYLKIEAYLDDAQRANRRANHGSSGFAPGSPYSTDGARQEGDTNNDNANVHFYDKYYDYVNPPALATGYGVENQVMASECFEVEALSDAVVGNSDYRNSTETTAASDVGNNNNVERGAQGTRTIHIRLDVQDGPSNVGYGAVQSGDQPKALVNLVRPKSNLYGGQTEAAKATTQYQTCGHYQPLNAQVLADNPNWVFNDIEVWGGDCFVTIWDNLRMAPNTSYTYTYSYGVYFPVESNVNTFLREGVHFSRNGANLPLIGINETNPEQYNYNSAYSTDEANIYYPALPLNLIPNNKFDYRVIYSEVKFNGETIDNFKNFLTNNFRDVEGYRGQVNNLRSWEGRLFYWQDHAYGYLPVNERVTTSSALGDPVTLGEGGVLTRFDEIKSYYGNQHQWSLTETENGFVWFDARRRAFLSAAIGGNTQELQVIHGLHSYFHNNVIGDILIKDNVLTGVGIHAAYDPRFKEVLMVFSGTDPLANFTIGFDNIDRQFSGMYSFQPTTMVDVGGKLIMGNELLVPSITPLTFYQVGNTVSEGSDIYVSLTDFTTGGSPQLPSLDSANWVKTGSLNTIYLHNNNDMCKFYGIVQPASVTAIINPNQSMDKVIDNVIYEHNGDFFSDITLTNSWQIAQDFNVDTVGNENYQLRNRKWYSSVPLDEQTGRLRDNFFELLMYKNNRLNNDPTISKNNSIVLVSLETKYRKTY